MNTLIGVKHKSGTLLSICGCLMLGLLSFTTAKTALANPSPGDTKSTSVVATCDARYWVSETHAGIVYGPGYYARLACDEDRGYIQEGPYYKYKCHHYYKHHKCGHRHHVVRRCTTK